MAGADERPPWLTSVEGELCGNCKFWQAPPKWYTDENPIWLWNGGCRRFPQEVQVSSGYGCGEWQAK
jgi:hypothetical protein